MEINVHNYKKVEDLKFGDRIVFLDDCVYTVKSDHLNCGGFFNSRIFDRLGVVDKYDFCSTTYGYRTTNGDWPCFAHEDYKAALRAIIAIFDALIEKGLIKKPKEAIPVINPVEESTSIKINVKTKFKPKIIL